MNTYFNIMLTENTDTNLKLLNEKMNDGFSIDERIEVGRSTLVVLRKHIYTELLTESSTQGIDARPTMQSLRYASDTIPF